MFSVWPPDAAESTETRSNTRRGRNCQNCGRFTIGQGASGPVARRELGRKIDQTKSRGFCRCIRASVAQDANPRIDNIWGVTLRSVKKLASTTCYAKQMILPENRTLAFSTLLFWGPILGTDWGSAEFYFGIRRVRFWQLQSPMLAFAAFHSGGQTRRITKWLF